MALRLRRLALALGGDPRFCRLDEGRELFLELNDGFRPLELLRELAVRAFELAVAILQRVSLLAGPTYPLTQRTILAGFTPQDEMGPVNLLTAQQSPDLGWRLTEIGFAQDP
jgi:hypothetical protein